MIVINLFKQYTLSNGLIITINKNWLTKLKKAELKYKKSIYSLISPQMAMPPEILQIPGAILENNLLLLKKRSQIEKRYWNVNIDSEVLFVKEDFTLKNYFIKQNEFFDSIKQSKFVFVPEYIFKIEDPVNFTRITVTKQIPLDLVYNKLIPKNKINLIKKIMTNLANNDLLPAILRPNHFLICKNKICLVDNSIGFPPINRNKTIFLDLIYNENLSFDWKNSEDLFKFETEVNSLPKPILNKLNKMRIENLINEFYQGEKQFNDFKTDIKLKVKKIFPDYVSIKKNSKSPKFTTTNIFDKLQDCNLLSFD
jgi:hypothetical protein